MTNDDSASKFSSLPPKAEETQDSSLIPTESIEPNGPAEPTLSTESISSTGDSQGNTWPKQSFGDGKIIIAPMDIHMSSDQGSIPNEGSSDGGMFRRDIANENISDGNTGVRFENSMMSKIQSASDSTVTSHPTRHTPAFNLARKLRRRHKARTKRGEGGKRNMPGSGMTSQS